MSSARKYIYSTSNTYNFTTELPQASETYSSVPFAGLFAGLMLAGLSPAKI